MDENGNLDMRNVTTLIWLNRNQPSIIQVCVVHPHCSSVMWLRCCCSSSVIILFHSIYEQMVTLPCYILLFCVPAALTKASFITPKTITEQLMENSSDRVVFNGIEFYLPQLAHMIVHLKIPTSALEQFSLVILLFHSASYQFHDF